MKQSIDIDNIIQDEMKLSQLRKQATDALLQLSEEQQLLVYQDVRKKRIKGLYAEHRMIQVIDQTTLPGICGNEDFCNTIGDNKVLLEYKYKNNTNTLALFTKTGGQFERDYKYKVDENFSRKMWVVFGLHTSNRFDIKPNEIIINGVYTKQNLSNKEGGWTDEFDGKTYQQFCDYIHSGSFYRNKINLSDLEFLYGEMQNAKDLGIRPHKVFWKAYKKNGELYYRSQAKLIKPNEHIDFSKVKYLRLDELYFDIHKLCFDCPHQEDNRKNQFYICVRHFDKLYHIRYNKYCIFRSEDFKDFDTFITKLLRVLNIHFSEKIEQGFIYHV